MDYFVEIILPISLAKTLTYRVTQAEFYLLEKGMRIAVPFGKTKVYTGLVLNKHHNSPQLYEAKEIHQIIDETPIVTTTQLKLWDWIASYYMCPLGDVYRAALPTALLLESESIISSVNEVVDSSKLTDDEYLIVEALSNQTSIKLSEAIDVLNKKKVFPVIQSLIAKGVVKLQEEMVETYKPKLIRYIRLHTQYQATNGLEELLIKLKNAQKQKNLVLSYFQLYTSKKKPITAKELTDFSDTSTTVLKALIEKSVFEEYYEQQDRVNFDKTTANQLQLSEAQQKAYQEINESFIKKDVVLLHGVTASGKTEVYFKLIEDQLEIGQQTLFLLPEIALTTQLVARITKQFGNKVVVYHSKYSNNERVEVYKNILQNTEKAQIIIGARSALFLPFTNLGLIIVDEEHEQTYKQVDPAPRYHARDTSIILAHYFKAKVVLGSATPSLETYYNTQKGKYGLVTLTQRYGNAILPEIVLVDIKESYFKKQMKGHLSQKLIDAISETLANGQQAILFQNRRGYAPIVECMSCGHVPQCPQCDVSLTYHKFKNQLRCHYCGHSIAKPTNCHVCFSLDITSKGFGTEQIELELATLFPTKNIKRMDQDTTRGKYAFERLIDSFKNREIDILVGTQMLAKGLDFDNVTLVGILNADNMLYFPDFRAFERSYQMMTQVAGRAGRGAEKGIVIIQTYNPMHNTIEQVTTSNYLGMYKEQIYERHNYHYPPFYKLIKITLKHKEFDRLKEASQWLYQVLKQNFTDIPILGPEEPPINRIRNEYIRTILIKIPQEKHLSNTKKNIQKIINSFEAISGYRSVKIVINVDVT